MPGTYLPHAYRLPEEELRGLTVDHLPRCVFIEVTNKCNLLCRTCPRTFVTYEQPHTMTWESFIHIVDQFPEMERAVLHGIGEPLMNKDLPRMIAFLKKRDVTVLFNTNAILLSEARGRALIASGLDELRVSMDGADPRTYALIHGVPRLRKVVANLKQFRRLQRELNADKPRVSIWMTGMRENVAELPDLVKLAAQVDVPEVYMQRLVYYLDSDNPPGFSDSSHALFDDFGENVERILADAEMIAHQLELTLRASGATDPRQSLAASRQKDLYPWTACRRPWTTAYITANGNCLPCCISPFATTNYGGLMMGNLLERDFAEIWNGEGYQALRNALHSEHPPIACSGCGSHWSL